MSEGWTSAVVRVGAGRGFVVALPGRRVIITAAHCLPVFPDPGPHLFAHERTYGELVGPLNGDVTLAAELLFADPVADVAILGAPDNQSLPEEAEAFDELIDGVEPLSLREDAPLAGDALLMSLDRQWRSCRFVRRFPYSPLTLLDAVGGIAGGMSGSPILDTQGRAIGVVCTTPGCPNPALPAALPMWFVETMRTPLRRPVRERVSNA